MRCLAGVEGEDALDCVRERVRITGGALSSEDCVTEEENDYVRARRWGEIGCDDVVIAGEGAVWVTSMDVGNKSC